MKRELKSWMAAFGSLFAGSAAVVLLLLWQVAPEAYSRPGDISEPWRAGLQSVECWFGVPEDLEVECAEMRTNPERGQFVLPVVIIRDNSPDHRDDPLVYLAGGPGNSSYLEADNVDHWFYWADIAGLSRDLILVDQRGTGLSRPRFHCYTYQDFVRNTLRENLPLREEHKAALAAVEECVGQMEVLGYSLNNYSTTQSAGDMNDLMQALGYDEWNVMGGSYGSRLALEWLRQSDNRIRAAILDSVYPLDKGSLAEWPSLLHNSFEYFWRACEKGILCGSSQPNPDGGLESRFWRAMAVLKETPVTLSVPLWDGGWPVKTVLNDHRFLGMVYSALYDDTLYTDIVRAIDEVLNGGETALQKLAAHSVNSELAPEFSTMVYLAVDCAESPDVSEKEFRDMRARYPKWSAYTEYAWQYDMCRPIPRRADLEAFKKPVQTKVPTLILSGGFDPVTPAAWAEELAARLPAAQRWHLDRAGHGVVASSACVHESLRKFLDAPGQSHSLPCE